MSSPQMRHTPVSVEVFFRSVCHSIWARVRFHVTAAQTPMSGVSLEVAKSSSATSLGRSNRVDNTSTCSVKQSTFNLT